MCAGCNRRPSLTLRITRFAQCLRKPFANYRVKATQHCRRVVSTLSQNAPELHCAPLENLSRPWTAAKLIELHFFRVLEIIEKNRIHLLSDAGVQGEKLTLIVERE